VSLDFLEKEMTKIQERQKKYGETEESNELLRKVQKRIQEQKN